MLKTNTTRKLKVALLAIALSSAFLATDSYGVPDPSMQQPQTTLREQVTQRVQTSATNLGIPSVETVDDETREYITEQLETIRRNILSQIPAQPVTSAAVNQIDSLTNPLVQQLSGKLILEAEYHRQIIHFIHKVANKVKKWEERQEDSRAKRLRREKFLYWEKSEGDQLCGSIQTDPVLDDSRKLYLKAKGLEYARQVRAQTPSN